MHISICCNNLCGCWAITSWPHPPGPWWRWTFWRNLWSFTLYAEKLQTKGNTFHLCSPTILVV